MLSRCYTERTACRLCGGAGLADVIDLGVQALHGQFPAAADPDPPRAPLVVCRCVDPQCGLVQSRYTVDPAAMFGRYWYRSSVSGTMRDHLRGVAAEACDMLMGRKGDRPVAPRFLDIAGNDGLLLDAVPVGTGVRVLVDPSDVPVAYDGIRHVKGFFPDALMLAQQFDLVFTIAAFYSVSDPVAFARAVKTVLAPDGLWCVEVAHLSDVLRNVDLGYFTFEHVTCLSVHTLTLVARRAGLKIARVEESPSNGGSIRCYLTHEYSTAYDGHPEWQARQGALWSHGVALAEDGDACDRFAGRGREVIERLRAEVVREVAAGGSVHALAASTKSGVLLQAAGLVHPLILAASDRDPRKVGRRMPGLGIPIIGEEESRRMSPTLYVCLLPASFHKEIIERERAAGTTADLLFVMPEVRRVKINESSGRAAA